MFKPYRRCHEIDSSELLNVGSCVCCGAMLDEELGQMHMIPGRCQMQRSQPVLVLGYRVGATLDEEPDQNPITP